jgi:nucleoside-diphosphate-sugar epimerase
LETNINSNIAMISGRHVIVGGAGSLGVHLQRALLGHSGALSNISIVDLMESHRPGSIVDKSIDFFAYNLGEDAISCLKKALNGADTVYSMVTPDMELGSKRDFLHTNQIGVGHLLEACKQVGVNKLVYVSTIATTNHFVASVNQNEQDPLPPIETYQSYYDITKRKGEEMILDANDDGKLHTCAIRVGGIIADPKDYRFRNTFASPGRVVTIAGERIDCISARDLSRALIKASGKLDESNNALAGKPLFVTKSKSEISPKTFELTEMCADILGWKKTRLSPTFVSMIRGAQRWGHRAFVSKDDESAPGVPPHMWMEIVNYEQTFDNSLARTMLDFEPEETWEQAVEIIVKEYRNQNPGKV